MCTALMCKPNKCSQITHVVCQATQDGEVIKSVLMKIIWSHGLQKQN